MAQKFVGRPPQFLGRPTTVNDRMQKNGGYMTGPDHPLDRMQQMGAGDDEQSEAQDPKSVEAAGVPHYREMDDAAKSCKTCEHFDDAETECELYNVQVKPFYVCDSWLMSGGDKTPPGTAAGQSAEEANNLPSSGGPY